jgi:ankyrin repeat protein
MIIQAKTILESIFNLFRIDERNVVNTDVVDGFISVFMEGARHQELIKWLTTVLRKWIINDFEGVQKVYDPLCLPHNMRQDNPWIQKAVDSGQDLWLIDIYLTGTRDLHYEVEHITDYFDYALDEPDGLPPDLKVGRDITRISYLDALKKADDWTKWLSRRGEGDEDLSGIEKIMSVSGYTWVYVNSPRSLDREGKLMQHCVGSYSKEVEQSHCKIISLRDSQNEPHITLEVRNRKINQIKGKQNKPPVPKYVPILADFLNYGLSHRLFNDIDDYDFDKMSLFFFENQVYQDALDLPKEFWSKGGLGKLIERGDRETVEILLKRGLDPDERYTSKKVIGQSEDVTPLSHALTVLDWRMADLLLDYGASPTKLSNGDRGVPPLILALYQNLYDIAERLIKLGAKIFPIQLSTAIWNGSKDKVDFLLKHGADPNLAASDNLTNQNLEEGPPLWVCHYRSSQGYRSSQWIMQNRDFAEKLFSYGADPNVEIRYHSEKKPLIFFVAENGAYDIFECFMKKIERYGTHNGKRIDIYQALVEITASLGRDKFLDLVLSKAKDIDVTNDVNAFNVNVGITNILQTYQRRHN